MNFAFFRTKICMLTNLNTARHTPATEKCNFTAEQRVSISGDLQCEPTIKTPYHRLAYFTEAGNGPGSRSSREFKRILQANGKHTCYAAKPRWYPSCPNEVGKNNNSHHS